MKKILLLLTAFIALTSCSGDDDKGSGDQFESNIKIDGKQFIPSEATSFYYESTDTTMYNRRLLLVGTNPVPALKDTIFLQLIYPKSRPNATGSYTNYLLEAGQTQLVGIGIYALSTGGTLVFSGDAINITDYGNNRLRVELENMSLIPIQANGSNYSIPITGSFEGTFTPVEE